MCAFPIFLGNYKDLDIGFIIDGSGSIRNRNPQDRSYENWKVITDFAAAVIDRLPRTGIQVGVVVFSSNVYIAFALNDYSNLRNAANATRNLVHPTGYTNTSGALYIARTQLFNSNKGDRPKVPNVAILMTDDPANRDTGKTIRNAEDLHSDGIRVISIGIGPSYTSLSAAETEVKAVSSPPHLKGKDYFSVPTYLELPSIKDEILDSLFLSEPVRNPTTFTMNDTSKYIVFNMELCGPGTDSQVKR